MLVTTCMQNIGAALKNSFLKQYGRIQARRYDIHDTVVVSGCPRSGSTWLAELLNTIPGTCILMEPLYLTFVPEAKAAGFSWRTEITEGSSWPEAETYLHRALTGQMLNTFTVSRANWTQLWFPKHWIVKFVRANRLLFWLANRFPTRVPILIIRHPCAVVSSQMHRPAWKDRSHIELAEIWCQDYLAPLSSPLPHPWLLVSYERLLRNSRQEMKRIFAVLNLEMPAAVLQRLHKPSTTTRSDSPVMLGKDPVRHWQRHLTSQQVADILQVADDYGITFYNRDPMPDSHWLESNPLSV
jgi:hypothetical protein